MTEIGSLIFVIAFVGIYKAYFFIVDPINWNKIFEESKKRNIEQGEEDAEELLKKPRNDTETEGYLEAYDKWIAEKQKEAREIFDKEARERERWRAPRYLVRDDRIESFKEGLRNQERLINEIKERRGL